MPSRSKILLYVAMVFGFCMLLAQLSWHTQRNQYNIQPSGKLQLKKDNIYLDEAGREWILEAPSKSVFHQPDRMLEIPNAYPGIEPAPEFNKDSPYLKFVSYTGQYSSAEVIIKPDGNYLKEGPKQGTYNYFQPEGVLGYCGHTLLDVVPHFLNSEYGEGGSK